VINDDFITAIRARLIADTTLTGLLAAGNASVGGELMAPRNVDGYPYVAIGIDDMSQADGFTIDVLNVLFTVTTVSRVGAGLIPPTNIMQRIYGDALSQVGRTPTYGLHRWAPGTIGTAPYAFNCPLVYRSGQVQDTDEDHYKFIERYQCFLSKSS